MAAQPLPRINSEVIERASLLDQGQTIGLLTHLFDICLSNLLLRRACQSDAKSAKINHFCSEQLHPQLQLNPFRSKLAVDTLFYYFAAVMKAITTPYPICSLRCIVFTVRFFLTINAYYQRNFLYVYPRNFVVID